MGGSDELELELELEVELVLDGVGVGVGADVEVAVVVVVPPLGAAAFGEVPPQLVTQNARHRRRRADTGRRILRPWL